MHIEFRIEADFPAGHGVAITLTQALRKMMFTKLKSLISGGNAGGRPTQATGKVPAGYFVPKPASELFTIPQRKLLLRQIWDNISLPEEVYTRLYLEPLNTLAECVQNVPACEDGEWSREGGYLDLTLKFTACSVRLAKGHMFPPGATPEEQAAKNTLWNAVVFWIALTTHLSLLTRVNGELLNGQCWMPGLARPPVPYRFRLGGPTHDETATFMAVRLLPASAISWLSGDRKAMQVMAAQMDGNFSSMPVIKDILDTARQITGAPDGTLAVTTSSVISAGIPASIPAITPSVTSNAVDLAANAPPGPELELNSAIELGETNLQSQLVVDNDSSSLSISDNDGTRNEQQGQEVTGDDDDTALLLSIFSATESNETPSEEPIPADSLVEVDLPEVALAFTDSTAVLKNNPDGLHSQLPGIDEPVLIKESTEIEKGMIDISPGTIPNNMAAQEVNTGEAFLNWLKSSVNERTISVNESDSLLHAVSGFMFISLPGAVFKFIEATGSTKSRKAIQSDFEKSGVLHMRSDQRFFKVRIYENEGLGGKFQKRSGYLIKLSEIYGSGEIKIKDSRCLLIEN